jgi:pimeloyl-ACP methyl ester carboxylesterase
MSRQLARSGDVELAYTVEGTGKETVLMIMGLGGRATDWGTEVPATVAERYRVVRFDNRGVGFSPDVPGGYTLNDMARDATAVLDAVGAERAHIVGYSMGGMISQLVALDHAERVNRLVLVSTHFGGGTVVPPTPEATRLFDPAEFFGRKRDAVSMMRFTLDTLAAPGLADRTPEALNLMVANVRAAPTSPTGFMGQIQAIMGSDRADRIRAIDKPTLIIHGTVDPLIPFENGKMLHERIPGSRLAVLEGIGHMPMLECPAKLAELLLGFLGE